MALALLFTPSSMTAEQYDEVIRNGKLISLHNYFDTLRAPCGALL